jgi:hypothetical protein
MKANDTWRIRYNVLYKQFEESGILKKFCIKNTAMAGNAQRVYGKRIQKMILESNIIGKSPVRKSRKGWVNAV